MPSTTPITIHMLKRHISIVHNPLTGWIVLCSSLLLTLSAYYFTTSLVERRAKEQFEFRAKEINAAIVDRLAAYERILNSGVALFAASASVERPEWATFVASLRLAEKYPGIQAMGYAIPIAPDQLESYTKEMREEGFKDFLVKPPGDRIEYTSITYIEPFDIRNRAALGYDMWSNETRRDAMTRAMDHATTASSGIITLVQETDESTQNGFLTYTPVYSSTPHTPATMQARRKQLQGWVYAAFRATDLMHGILGTTDTNISFEVHDGESRTKTTKLYASNNLDSTHTDQALATSQTMLVHGRPWTIYYHANEKDFVKSAVANQPTYVLIGGIFVNLLLFYVIISLHFINSHRKKITAELQLEFEQNEANLAIQSALIEATEKESETFFELAPEAFLVVNRRGQIVKANRRAHTLFEYEQGTLRGEPIENLVPENIRSQHTALREEFHKNASQRIMGDGSKSLRGKKKGGELFDTNINLSPIEHQGLPHVVAAISDISTQKNIEKSLASAKEIAESASRSKSEFVANMSHEIRTPLNAVLGAVQLLDKTTPTELQQKYIRMIRSSGESLLGIINDILDFSKIEAGAMDLTQTEFGLDEVLSRVAILMSINIGEKDLDLVIDVDPRVKQHFIGDPLRLQQVLINLSSNALKFTKKGQVVILIEPDQSRTETADSDSQSLVFRVKDSGIGMTQEQQSKLFNAFSQADTSISREFGGTGLGLVISSKIMALMDSKIHLTSQPNLGSEFYFPLKLPIAQRLNSERDLLDQKPKNVLILDDNHSVQKALKNIFAQWGWHIQVYSSWASTVHEMSNPKAFFNIDFVLVDYNFSSQSCTELLSHLVDMGLAETTGRVLLLNNNQQAATVMSDHTSAFNAHIVKPLLRSSILDALQEASFATTGNGIIALENAELTKNSKLNGLRVLLVEDNVFNQTIAIGMLEDMGANIEVANHGAEAVSIIKGNIDGFDLILMDIQMPVMDGLTATRILRKELHYTTPIIALTAGVLNSEKDQYLQAGMDNLVPKPIDENDLFRAINRAVKRNTTKDQKHPDNSTSEPPALAQSTNAPQETSNPASAFDKNQLDAISKGNPKRVKRMIGALNTILNDGETIIRKAVKNWQEGEPAKAEITLKNFSGVVTNYGGANLANKLNTLIENLEAHPSTPEEIINQVISCCQAYCAGASNWIKTQNAEQK